MLKHFLKAVLSLLLITSLNAAATEEVAAETETQAVAEEAAPMEVSEEIAPVAVSEETAPPAKDIAKEIDSLGGNEVLFEKAKALHPETTVRAVQNRIMSRRHRLEIAPEYASVFGGDAYNKTQNVGLNAHYHFTPHWSLGFKYNHSFNELRTEGEALLTDPLVTNGQALVADIDYPKSQMLGLLNWYPFYGKINLLDFGIAHFDVYTILGYGQIALKSGSTPTYTAGGGVGFWFSQRFSTRAEVRYQGYKAKNLQGESAMNTTVLGIQVGYVL